MQGARPVLAPAGTRRRLQLRAPYMTGSRDTTIGTSCGACLRLTGVEFVVEPWAEGVSDRLPSVERRSWEADFDRAALICTHGHNAGGYDSNVNDLRAQVWLQVCDGGAVVGGGSRPCAVAVCFADRLSGVPSCVHTNHA